MRVARPRGALGSRGRRSLLVLGMASMAATMLVGGIVALATDPGDGRLPEGAGLVVVVMIIGYMFSFGVSWGFGARCDAMGPATAPDEP